MLMCDIFTSNQMSHVNLTRLPIPEAQILLGNAGIYEMVGICTALGAYCNELEY